MFEVPYVQTDRKDSPTHVRADAIPRFSNVRRVPVCYQRVLPLAVSKRYQCVVLGASSHTLTVGITEPACENAALLYFLHRLTGSTIFPVLIEQRRMHLLIARIERHQRFGKQSCWPYDSLRQTAYVRLILALQKQVRKDSE